MSGNWELDDPTFNRLLDWLDADSDRAGLKYEKIRHKLIAIFASRGCPVAEELADVAFDRVSKKVDEISSYYVGDPALFVFGVGNKVYLEWRRNNKLIQLEYVRAAPSQSHDKEIEDRCLTSCLAGLDDDDRKLLLDYYSRDKQAKIERRKALARELGLTDNALKIKVHRLRVSLRDCLLKCIERYNERLD
ncbi:MAG: hypothetical protein IPM66_22560 [Acidobacteriota bacterium]|nr:MAG: hypothetical protein IPM66_22560 [Acidobacteriota bacterium]